MNYSAQQVRARSRAAVKRREEDIEEEEVQGGELNLVPYLDIVTNLMLYLLVSVSAGVILGQINTTLPDKSNAASASTPQPQVKPEETPLQMILTVQRDKVLLWSISQLEGTLAAPLKVFPVSGQVGAACDGDYMCQSNSCDGESLKCLAGAEPPVPVYDYRAINAALYDVAKKHYANKARGDKTYAAILQADGTIPYGTIISMMGAMRCKLPAPGANMDTCLMPSQDEELKKKADPISLESNVYDSARAPYNPDTMALFPDILFSSGFE
jgi:biopolymer transport protein TolR